jgi:hypothetical protein
MSKLIISGSQEKAKRFYFSSLVREFQEKNLLKSQLLDGFKKPINKPKKKFHDKLKEEELNEFGIPLTNRFSALAELNEVCLEKDLIKKRKEKRLADTNGFLNSIKRAKEKEKQAGQAIDLIKQIEIEESIRKWNEENMTDCEKNMLVNELCLRNFELMNDVDRGLSISEKLHEDIFRRRLINFEVSSKLDAGYAPGDLLYSLMHKKLSFVPKKSSKRVITRVEYLSNLKDLNGDETEELFYLKSIINPIEQLTEEDDFSSGDESN